MRDMQICTKERDDTRLFPQYQLSTQLIDAEINQALASAIESSMIQDKSFALVRAQRQFALLACEQCSHVRERMLFEHERESLAFNSLAFVECFIFDCIYNDAFESMLRMMLAYR